MYRGFEVATEKLLFGKAYQLNAYGFHNMTSPVGATPSANQDYFTEEVVYTTSFEVS